IGAVEVFHCPADHGDALNTQVKTCWEGWGNSYLVEWANDAFRVEKVTGDSKAARGTPQATPNRESRFALRPVTKVIQGDWPWHANRTSTDKRTVMHNNKGKRYEDMLFGDSHVENYRFPKEMDGWISTLPDMNFKWWLGSPFEHSHVLAPSSMPQKKSPLTSRPSGRRLRVRLRLRAGGNRCGPIQRQWRKGEGAHLTLDSRILTAAPTRRVSLVHFACFAV